MSTPFLVMSPWQRALFPTEETFLSLQEKVEISSAQLAKPLVPRQPLDPEPVHLLWPNVSRLDLLLIPAGQLRSTFRHSNLPHLFRPPFSNASSASPQRQSGTSTKKRTGHRRILQGLITPAVEDDRVHDVDLHWDGPVSDNLHRSRTAHHFEQPTVLQKGSRRGQMCEFLKNILGLHGSQGASSSSKSLPCFPVLRECLPSSHFKM